MPRFGGYRQGTPVQNALRLQANYRHLAMASWPRLVLVATMVNLAIGAGVSRRHGGKDNCGWSDALRNTMRLT